MFSTWLYGAGTVALIVLLTLATSIMLQMIYIIWCTTIDKYRSRRATKRVKKAFHNFFSGLDTNDESEED